MTVRPIAWTKALDESDGLLIELSDRDFTIDDEARIVDIMEVLRASGKLTTAVEHRRGLSAALAFWASYLGLESNMVVLIPRLADPVEGSALVEMPPATACDELLSGRVIQDREIRDLRLGGETSVRVGRSAIALTNSRVVLGDLRGIDVAVFSLDESTLIDVNFVDINVSRELQASHARIFGGSLVGITARSAEFQSAVFRYTRMIKCTFREVDFSNAELGFSRTSDPDGINDHRLLLPWITGLQLRDRGPVTFVGCDFGSATFDGATLTGVVFERCIMRGATFEGTLLADVSGPELSCAVFRDCELTGARLAGAIGLAAANMDARSQLGTDVAAPA